MSSNLLTEPLISTDRGSHSLPGLFAAMSRGEVAAFPALRPHQRPAWHMFCVQLAVLALDAAGLRDLPEDEDNWRRALRVLTPDFADDAPWHLIQTDRKHPAFLQPPDPGGEKWTPVATPDALDMLITSRNHDIKREIAREPEPQDWIFALVSLQTMEGYGGKDSYGIARMNGGSSSRAMIALAPAREGSVEVDPSAWWARDLRTLLTRRSGIAGLTLLWLYPWGDGPGLDLDRLDPMFIEVCRRIRLSQAGDRITAERSTSKAARVAAKEAKGNTGDPWAPLHKTENKSFTLGEQDWSHEVLVRLLYGGDWKVPDLALPQPGEEAAPLVLIAEAFARGNSKTDGFRSRLVPVPKAMVKAGLFGTKPVSVAAEVQEDIDAIETALRDGLSLIAAEGDRKKRGKPHYARAQPARDAYRHAVDQLFFPELWLRASAKVDADFTLMRREFLTALAAIARREFDIASSAIPCASLFRPRAEARSRDALERGIAKVLQPFQQQDAQDA
ncbi:CRISPR-associated protein Cse1 [Paracoccus kondratievae]|uniref:hypothetical protein n=1 Tax=Paracoccus TaxID=265 RepID=UPI000225FA1D|nr:MULTISPECIES: hypothetical protein [Paracoccus]QFQ88367.1 CRISPR-associated protein Cse1 [Paracoccus kondratievae]